MTNSAVTQMGVLDLIFHAGWVVKFVLFALLGSSVLCWAIMFQKYKLFKKVLAQNNRFLDVFWEGKSLEDIAVKAEKFPISPTALVFQSGYKELKKLSITERTEAGEPEVANIHRALQRAANDQVSRIEKHLSWLATTASSAPFVGLFGTVWGIMDSFQMIGASGAANLAVVAPGISEALIATAAGLAAAIPAVIAYNHFAQQTRKIAVDIDSFGQDFLNIIQRSLLGGKKK